MKIIQIIPNINKKWMVDMEGEEREIICFALTDKGIMPCLDNVEGIVPVKYSAIINENERKNR